MQVMNSPIDNSRKMNGRRKTPPTDFFKLESNRLLSFKCWSSDCPVRPFALAYFGFFCLSPRETECFSCHKRVTDWKTGDDPFRRHVNMSPNCRFLRQPRESNVPLKQEERCNILKKLNDLSGGVSEIFKLEENRLLSFHNSRAYDVKNFPVWYGLAADGFFGIDGNTVECFACQGQVSLNLQFKAVEVHDMMFKHCPLPSATPCGNIPIAPNAIEKIKQFFYQPRSFVTIKTLQNEDYRHNLAVITERDLSNNGREEH